MITSSAEIPGCQHCSAQGKGPSGHRQNFKKKTPKVAPSGSGIAKAPCKRLAERSSTADSPELLLTASLVEVDVQARGQKSAPKAMATVRRNRATCTWKRNLSVGARRSKPTGAPAGGEEEEKPATEHLTGPGESPLLSWHQPHYVFSFSFRLLGGGEVNS